MVLNWSNLTATALLVGAGCAATYAVFRRRLARAEDAQRLATARELLALRASIRGLEAQLAGLSELRQLQAAATPGMEAGSATAAPDEVIRLDDDEVSAEIMAVISAAATEFLGRKIRILSAKLMQAPHETMSAWSQQGRVFVQTSHNPRG